MDVVTIWLGLSLLGTGFVVDYQGEQKVLTNWHVCSPLTIIQGKVNESKATVLKYSVQYDLCLLTANVKAKPIKVSYSLIPGEYVKTSGFPNSRFYSSGGRYLGPVLDNLRFPYNLSKECPKPLSRKGTACVGEYLIGDTTLYAAPGASGSPVVNRYGELIGVIQTSDRNNHGGMVLLEQIRAFLKE